MGSFQTRVVSLSPTSTLASRSSATNSQQLIPIVRYFPRARWVCAE